jgi:hypothetical protein
LNFDWNFGKQMEENFGKKMEDSDHKPYKSLSCRLLGDFEQNHKHFTPAIFKALTTGSIPVSHTEDIEYCYRLKEGMWADW